MSRHSVIRPNPFIAPFTTLYSSLSAELFTTTDWVFAQALMQWLPNIATPPEVDFRDRRHPAQSASVKMQSLCWAACHLKSITASGCVIRYLPNLFNLSWQPLLGLLVLRANSMAENATPGLSEVR